MEAPEGEDSLHRCGMCGSCGKQPWWAPEVLKELPPRDRIRIKRRLEDGRRAFVAVREEAAAKKAASEAASAALKAFAATKHSPSPTETRGFSSSGTVGDFALGASLAGDTDDASAATPGSSVLKSMNTKKEAGFGDDNNKKKTKPEMSFDKVQDGLKEMRESVLATYDSDIDSDHGTPKSQSGPTLYVPKAGNNTKTNNQEQATTPDEAYHTPKTDSTRFSPKTNPEPITLDANIATPNTSMRNVVPETPELGAGATISNKGGAKIPASAMASADFGVVSLQSSPETQQTIGSTGSTGSTPPLELKVPPLQPTPNADVKRLEAKVTKQTSRIRELELHVEALECALKAKTMVAQGKKPKKLPGGIKGEAQRLRDEVDSLRLTVDFLFKKLQRYENKTAEIH